MMRSAVLLLVCASAAGMQLKADPTNSCKATGNGTMFDISKIMRFPVIANGPRFQYTFSPCDPIPCSGDPNNKEIAICQAADFPRSCGNTNQALWFVIDTYPWSWKILYPNGMDWRASWVTFRVNETAERTEFKALGEEPYLIYNFEVTGRCLGQPNAPADCN
eukprot:TRINITY_DN583_c0_g1_i1.p1 TRINITY_DN583_c0_g1~~TRINITY_DN583_c0_g1_i1.p1  ORF type:complete len:163 (+),score=63.91 TRINITY_DN583_c0_g1_i1:61-549(+)